ncbi:MAG TPA: ABC transporter permease [Chthoniobacterales bacterium]|nr:ABC transporter permease [Chthoniobacterales bacterium]
MKGISFGAIASVAKKEFLHIYRDRRVLWVILILPPLFTLLFGHAFEATDITNVPALLINRDGAAPQAQEFVDIISRDKTFRWRTAPPETTNESDLLSHGVMMTLVVPPGWSDSLLTGDPQPVILYIDGSDYNNGERLEGKVKKNLADFQMKQRDHLVENLPDDVIELGKQLRVEVRKQFVSLMESWGTDTRILYNPGLRYIDYVVPGIIGLILQLLTVTLMACTIARERESGTLYQLLVTSLQRAEIVIGKVIPYLAISICLIAVVGLVARFHFDVRFRFLSMLSLICVLFLLCSLGLGLLISAFSRTQTQAIQFSVFFLLPVFMLSGAFAPLQQLPESIRGIAEFFPLTYFCRSFRLVNMYQAALSFYIRDLLVLFAGCIITFAGAAFLLKRIEQ